MADIKIREMKKGTIKTLDKAAVASERIKNVSAKTKDKAQANDNTDNSSPTAYASDNISRGAENASGKVINKAEVAGKKSMAETRKNIIKARNKSKDLKATRSEIQDITKTTFSGREISTEMIRKISLESDRAAILGNIACGLPQFAEENIEEYVSLPEALFGKGPFYILRARGESMIDAGINPRDLVVIRSQQEAKEGDIVVALIDNEATLKRFYKDKKNKRIRLHPENETMEDIFVDNCNIQGVAVNVIKRL